MPELATKETCTGCGGCANACPHGAISIAPDPSGFLMPSVDTEKCVECKLCERSCPIVNGVDLRNPEVKDAYAFWDNKTRKESSSGGAFSAIARWVLERGGVVFGAAWEDGFRCAHIGVDSKENMSALRGSKYLQSDIRNTFREARQALKEGRYVLFTGTPCQIAGLRSFLIKPYERLVTVDIVCHGVPSNSLFLSYIDKLKSEYKRYRDADGFEFRKRNGWGYLPSMLKSRKRLGSLVGVPNLYMKAFEKSMVFRESCYDCHFNGLSRVGDITIADFWGIGKLGKFFRHDVTKGVSLLFANTGLGKAIIDSLNDCFIEKRDLKEAVALNHNIISSAQKPAVRDEVLGAFMAPELTLADIDKKFSLSGTGIKDALRNLLDKTGLIWLIKSTFNKIRSI